MTFKPVASFLTTSPKLPADYEQTTYPEAVAVSSTDEAPNILKADLKRDWCIGLGISEPHLPPHNFSPNP
jgi:hypothetical protein